MRFKERDQSSVRGYQRISLGVCVSKRRSGSVWWSWWKNRDTRSRKWLRSWRLSWPLLASSLPNTGRPDSSPCGTSRNRPSKNVPHPINLSLSLTKMTLNWTIISLLSFRLLRSNPSWLYLISACSLIWPGFTFSHTFITDYFIIHLMFAKFSATFMRKV